MKTLSTSISPAPKTKLIHQFSAKILETDVSTSIFQLNKNWGRATRRVFWEELCSFEEAVGFVASKRSESALLGGIDTDVWTLELKTLRVALQYISIFPESPVDWRFQPG